MGQAPPGAAGTKPEPNEKDVENRRARSNTAGSVRLTRKERENDDRTNGELISPRGVGGSVREDPRRKTIAGNSGQPQLVELDLSNKSIKSEELRAHFSASPVGRKITSTPVLSESTTLQVKTHHRRSHSRSASTSNSTPNADALILTYLNLSNNQLTYLDGLEDIQNLSLLSELDLSYNLISNIQNSRTYISIFKFLKYTNTLFHQSV